MARIDLPDAEVFLCCLLTDSVTFEIAPVLVQARVSTEDKEKCPVGQKITNFYGHSLRVEKWKTFQKVFTAKRRKHLAIKTH